MTNKTPTGAVRGFGAPQAMLFTYFVLAPWLLENKLIDWLLRGQAMGALRPERLWTAPRSDRVAVEKTRLPSTTWT